MGKIGAAIISVLSIVVLMCFPSAVAEGISRGLESSAKLLVPSLFPFMVLSSFIIRSGASEYIGKLFAPVTKLLFKLPFSAASAVILSFIGGFPVGAKCVRLLYSSGKITHNQAERMICFCVCSGPAFLLTAVGAIMLHSMTAGIILYLSQIISGIILGMASVFICRDDKEKISVSDTNRDMNIMESFIMSCSDGADAIIELTALVAVFSAGISVISSLGADNNIITLILEVTTACKNMVNTGCPLWLLAFATGYGGLCVHFQIFNIFKDIKINKIRFEIFRLANAVISSILTYIICIFVNPAVQTFVISENTNAEITSTSIVGAVALVIMSGVFLMSMKSSKFSCINKISQSKNNNCVKYVGE